MKNIARYITHGFGAKKPMTGCKLAHCGTKLSAVRRGKRQGKLIPNTQGTAYRLQDSTKDQGCQECRAARRRHWVKGRVVLGNYWTHISIFPRYGVEIFREIPLSCDRSIYGVDSLQELPFPAPSARKLKCSLQADCRFFSIDGVKGSQRLYSPPTHKCI